MKYIDSTLATPADNLACDEALLDEAESGASGETLLFWEAKTFFVVVGYANHVAREVDLAACREQHIPVLRRCSGGGTVVQGPGCLSYSLILKINETGPTQTIASTNAFIMQRQQSAIAKLLGRDVRIQGHTDLAVEGLKFSGNAQRRRRNFLIFHGTFLLNFDLARIEQLLRMPSLQPDYRQNRQHGEFLTNLNLSAESVKNILKKEWHALEPLEQLPTKRIEELSQKYSTTEWNFKF